MTRTLTVCTSTIAYCPSTLATLGARAPRELASAISEHRGFDPRCVALVGESEASSLTSRTPQGGRASLSHLYSFVCSLFGESGLFENEPTGHPQSRHTPHGGSEKPTQREICIAEKGTRGQKGFFWHTKNRGTYEDRSIATVPVPPAPTPMAYPPLSVVSFLCFCGSPGRLPHCRRWCAPSVRHA